MLARIHGPCGVPEIGAGRCLNGAERIEATARKQRERESPEGAERVNSCVVVSYHLVPRRLSHPFHPFHPFPARTRPPLSSGAQADLNIKGGLNLTYTTLNHVTSVGL